MEECAKQNPGGMIAVIGMEAEKVYTICQQVSEQIGSSVTVANDNCEGQVTVAGTEHALEAAIEAFKQAGVVGQDISAFAGTVGPGLVGCLLVVLAGTMVGIMFSLIATYSKSIWNSAVVHALWNLIIVGGILEVGNASSEYSINNYVLSSKSFLITGGDFGIESSLIALIFYSLVSIIVVVILKKRKETK